MPCTENEATARSSMWRLSGGVDFSGWSSSAAFGDYDLDGDLDFYLANYIDFDPGFRPADPSYCTWRGLDVFCGPRGMPGERDQFYRNDGPSADWTFTEASAAVGIADYEYYGFAALAGDWDEDGDLDIYIANDSTPNVLYRNDRGAFADVSAAVGDCVLARMAANRGAWAWRPATTIATAISTCSSPISRTTTTRSTTTMAGGFSPTLALVQR